MELLLNDAILIRDININILFIVIVDASRKGTLLLCLFQQNIQKSKYNIPVRVIKFICLTRLTLHHQDPSRLYVSTSQGLTKFSNALFYVLILLR